MHLVEIDLLPIIPDVALVLVCKIKGFMWLIAARSDTLCDLRVIFQELQLQ